MTKEYYKYSPRGFANEYSILTVKTEVERQTLHNWFDRASREDTHATLTRISSETAAELEAAEQETAKLNPAFSGYAEFAMDFYDWLSYHGKDISRYKPEA